MAQKRTDNATGDDGGNEGYDDLDGISVIDPATGGSAPAADLGSGSDGGEPRKRRGRPRKSDAGTGADTSARGEKKASSKVLAEDTFVVPITLFHMAASARLPEMALGEGEAEQLSKAMVKYLRHSDVAVSPKTKDLMVLIYALAMIEGTKLLAVVMRVKQEAAERARNKAAVEGQNVFPMDAVRG